MSETPKRTLLVALVLCGVCSVLVSSAYVMLKPKQDFNREIDFKTNILKSAGLLSSTTDVNETFKQVESIVVDLETGKIAEGVDPKSFDQSKADKNPEYVQELGAKDIAGIKRRSRLQKVYLVKKDGAVDQIVLHIYGKGLWSTMKGFLSLDKDAKTVRGFNYGLTTSYGTDTTENGSFSTGAYTANISSLTCGTTYHFRSYATNSAGTGYG